MSPKLANADWCVGDAPTEWDVSFTDRLMHTFRGLFSRTSAASSRVNASHEVTPRLF
jgi:hypothetical protein